MNKGSFAPKGFKYPDDFPDETDNQQISDAQMQRDNEGRLASLEIMDQLDAATLKTFRRRDEFEIRDIRRRLGLPVDNENRFLSMIYNKTRLDRIHPFESKSDLASDTLPLRKLDEIEDAAKELESTEAESVAVQASAEQAAEESQLYRQRFDDESDEKIHKAEIDDAERNKPPPEEIDPTEEYIGFGVKQNNPNNPLNTNSSSPSHNPRNP